VFECLASNLLQISPVKLCFEKLRFILNFVFRMQEMLFQRPRGGEKNGPFGSFVPPLKNPLKNALKVPMRNEVNNV
jgi:hypothetical protein